MVPNEASQKLRIAFPSPQSFTIRNSMFSDTLNEWAQATRESLAEIEAAVLAIESGRDVKEQCYLIRCLVHNMKGEAGFMGFDRISGICHQIEDAIENCTTSADFPADLMLKAVDWFYQVLEHLESGAEASEPAPVTQSSLRVLIVEDGTLNRTMMQKYLETLAQCDMVVNGEEAISAFENALNNNTPYDLILLDIMMPKMNGQDALAQIRKLEATRNIWGSDSVKVIMTTTLKDSKNVLSAFKTGCEGYLVKPIRKSALIGKMRELNLMDAT